MLQHGDIWRAIDRLAAKHGMSPSGLARRAGLDPTTFNKSKRVTQEGRKRWLNTESLAKVLAATGASLADFAALFDGEDAAAPVQKIPVIGYAQAGGAGFFDGDGHPSGNNWDQVLFPRLNDPHAFGLEISGGDLAPLYRDGDIVVVSPGAGLRRGDRVAVKTRGGEIMVKQLLRQGVQRVELAALNGAQAARSLEAGEIDWIARIVWASQ